MFVRGQHGVRMQASKRLAFVAFLLLNAYAVIRPDDTSKVAHLFGIGRGVDLLLYLLIVTFVFAVINVYLRLRDSEQRVTDLPYYTSNQLGAGVAFNSVLSIPYALDGIGKTLKPR